MDYLTTYYFVANIAILSIPFLYGSISREASDLRVFFSGLILLTFILGMLRTAGVDVENYRRNFENIQSSDIEDPGFRFLIELFNYISLPFESLVAFAGVVTIIAVFRLSRHYAIEFYCLLILWFLHLIVVREFAQFRVGLAVSLVIIGLTTRSKFLKLALYIFGSSVHATAAALVFGYEGCLWAARRKDRAVGRITLLGGLLAILLLGALIPYLSFIDPRIELYISWDREGYGDAVNQYSQVIINSGITLFVWSLRRSWQNDIRIKSLFYLQLASLFSFIAFREVAIFAFRISNILFSLYPVLLLLAIGRIRARIGEVSVSRLLQSGIIMAAALALMLRPGSTEIIRKVVL